MSTSSRREFLRHLGGGFGLMALGDLLARAPQAVGHHPAKAKAVIQIFCPGGMSQVDTWDHKPELAKRTGTPFDPGGHLQFFASKPGNCQGSHWAFQKHGACGRPMSALFPRLATCVDDMAFVHSMHSKSALHGPAMFMMNSGFILPGFPSMGAWVTYGLGSEADNLPAYVVLPDPRGLPPGGVLNWGAGFLPAKQQGTPMQTAADKPPLADLFAPEAFKNHPRDHQLLTLLNRRHAQERPGNSELEARIKAYEMAAKLQMSAPEATRITGESAATQKLYQLEDADIGPFGRQCLLARRLVERGVRFVQIFCGAENTTARKIRPNWDSHEDLPRDHGYWGRVLDGGAAALLKDLKVRGLLDETLVICTTEFGRQPAAQGSKGQGRDHNAGAFTAWLAGGGIQGGTSYGATDELGWKAAVNPTYSYDFHATALHLLGIDHERLTFYHNGIERRLTDVHGHVIKELIA
ncbi:MAG: DUF1501 domain-containing protein [Verrucomicrobia subdivision 3 bacterium]|nr:DUF1501 domain-containing protein [Limisphaerales bacterium]